MNVESWKQKRNSHIYVKETIFYRHMSGYMLFTDSPNTAAYYPDSLVTFINNHFPRVKIEDVVYKIDEVSKDEYQCELITIEFAVEHHFINLDLYLNTYKNGCEFDFGYSVDETSKMPKELEETIYSFYQLLKNFLEENSPNRLFLLTTSVTEHLPKWLKRKINQH